jgi:CubicO group peptidase (beta-lactamase class C family)
MEWLPGRGLVRAENVKVDATMHAAGGLGTSAADLARWLCLHLGDGAVGDARLLSAAGAREMRREQAAYPKAQGSLRIRTGRGLAWETGTFMGRPFLTHGGGYEGASAYAAMLPDQKCGFVILMNSGGPATGLSDVIAIDLLNRLTGENVAPDLLKQYLDRVRSRRAEAEHGAMEAPSTELPATAVTGAPDAYTGDFVSRDWGTFHVLRQGDALRVRWGACTLRVRPAQPDSFTITGPTAQGTEGRFEKGADGKAGCLILGLPQGPTRFAR